MSQPFALRRLRAALVCSAMLLLAACGNRVDLMASVPEAEANEVLTTLLAAGINVEKVPGKDGMVSLRVGSGQVAHALSVMRERGLPRDPFSGIGKIFKKEGMISSPIEERARYLYALSQELENTLAKIDGVIAARVHVVLPERGIAGEPGTPSTASVFVKYMEGYNLDAVQPQIRRLVTNAIPNLAADRVSIVLVAAQPRAPGGRVVFDDVLGYDVSPAAASGLRILLMVLAGLFMVAAGGAGYLLWRYVLAPKRAAPALAPVTEESAAAPQAAEAGLSIMERVRRRRDAAQGGGA
ncbi:type III secretion system inner membrane ring lipoprotein SctJ [Imbroritus primus]|uniref:type III secretion system inner membrane ring lipoprotein SctJ n=1 Tax=Imbroritus primus TaxID=3058603 RepID=UPI003D161BE0